MHKRSNIFIISVLIIIKNNMRERLTKLKTVSVFYLCSVSKLKHTGILRRIADISSRAQERYVSHGCVLYLQDAGGSADILSDTADFHRHRLSYDRPLPKHKPLLHRCCYNSSRSQRLDFIR